MTSPKNIADHGWLANDDLSDAAQNLAYWLADYGVVVEGNTTITASGTTAVPLTLNGASTSQTGNLINALQSASGNPVFQVGTVTTAVNGVKVIGSATGDAVQVSAVGTDSNVNLSLVPKGAGLVNIQSPALSVGNTGATGTLARVGTNATGPSGTASVGWLPVAAAGTACFIPVWQ